MPSSLLPDIILGMNIAILGFAGQGQSAYEYWNKPQNELTICDHDENIQVPTGTQTQLGKDYLKDLDRFDLLIRTPALHPRDIQQANPDSPDILDKVWSNTNEFFKVCPSKNIIGVTGTKGKGTTSTLIAKMLEAAGKRVHLGGNIGTPPLNLLKNAEASRGDAMQGGGEKRTESYIKYGEGVSEPTTQQSPPSDSGVTGSASKQTVATQGIQPDDWVVLELANFQLIDLKYSPHIAVCLMVVPEHLDWHADTNEYIRAKQNIFAFQKEGDLAVINLSSPMARQVGVTIQSKVTKRGYAVDGSAGVADKAFCQISGDKIVVDDTTVARVGDVALLGQHNLQNVCAALAATWEQIKSNSELIPKVLRSFTGLEHRLELVRELGGVKYYDDSFGTTPETAIVAIEAFKEPKVVVLGGSDKGANYDQLAQAVLKGNVRAVITIGVTGTQITDTLRKAGFSSIIEGSSTMKEIVDQARGAAKPGDVVLLSTACASFGMFKDYKDRGEQFSQAVKTLS